MDKSKVARFLAHRVHTIYITISVELQLSKCLTPS